MVSITVGALTTEHQVVAIETLGAVLKGFPLLSDEYKDVKSLREFDDIEGIPLTEDWLKQFDFTPGTISSADSSKPEIKVWAINVSSNIWLEYREWIELDMERDPPYFRDGEWLLEIKSVDREERLYKNPYYVHELQNLYFALTGLELRKKERTS